MYKKSLLLFIVILYSMISYGQMYIGLSGGPTFTKFSKPENNIWLIKSYTGYTLSIPVVYRLNQYVSFQSGLSYYSIGSKATLNASLYNVIDTNDPIYQSLLDALANSSYTYKLQYISIPLTFKYTIPVSNVGFYGRAGGYISYAVGGNVHNKNYSISRSIDFSNDKISKLDVGLLMGIGCQIDLGRGYLFAEVMYMLGLHNLNKASSFDPADPYANYGILYGSNKYENRGFILSAGYMISLGKGDK